MAVTQGADIHANDNGALKWSAGNGHLEIVKILIAQGADVHANDDEALREAAAHGHIDVVKFLLTQGANIHANHDEALKWSARNGRHDVWQVLSSLIQEEKLRAAADSNFVSGPNVSMASSATMPKQQHTELKKIKRSKI